MKRRPGLTLVEMLVATALVLFIMVIISEAFVTGLESFHQLKAIGDMNEKLRSAAAILRRDLRADHFGSGSLLSNMTYPPTKGFFRIQQGGISQPDPGSPDADGNPSKYATNHILHFSINLSVPPGSDPNFKINGPENYLSAAVPAATPYLANRSPSAFQDGFNYYGQWGEVAYFLRALTGQTTSGSPPMQRYALYRRQLVVLNQSDADFMNNPVQLLAANWPGGYYEVSSQPGTGTPQPVHFNSPGDLVSAAAGLRSLSYLPAYPILGERGESATVVGADLLLTDVLSFDVQIFMDLAHNPNQFWSDVPGTYFDTGAPFPATTPYQIMAVQISLRIWDLKTQKARQITIMQDM
jgi:hypothetical protein